MELPKSQYGSRHQVPGKCITEKSEVLTRIRMLICLSGALNFWTDKSLKVFVLWSSSNPSKTKTSDNSSLLNPYCSLIKKTEKKKKHHHTTRPLPCIKPISADECIFFCCLQSWILSLSLYPLLSSQYIVLLSSPLQTSEREQETAQPHPPATLPTCHSPCNCNASTPPCNKLGTLPRTIQKWKQNR